MTDTELATRLRAIAYDRPNNWRQQLFALADRLEADDAEGLEAIMNALREPRP